MEEMIMTNSRKKLVGLLSLGVLIAITIAGTLAYLTDTTPTKANTFTIGKVGITLAEPAWDKEGANHKIIPGTTIAKDPTITVTENSEAAYVFVKLAFSANLAEFKQFYTLNYQDDWTLLEESADEKILVYKEVVPTSTAGTKLSPVFTEIAFSNTLSAENLEQLKEAKIEVTGYAIQASGFDDAVTAWAELSK